MEGGLCVLRLLLLCLFAVVSASAEGQNKTAYPGDDVTLTCDAREYVPLKVVEWSKSEGNTEHVLVHASQNSDPKIRDQNYKGRVELKDMKNGDVSLTLKSVTVKDSGTYLCYAVKQTNRRKKSIAVPKPVNTIHLNVAPPDAPPADAPPADAPPSGHGHIGLMVIAVVIGSLVVAALFAWKKKKNDTPPPHDEAVETLKV